MTAKDEEAAFGSPRPAPDAPRQSFVSDIHPPNMTPVTFGPETAASRSGNYLLAFGGIGSGKSTLHSHLLRYLETIGDFRATPEVMAARAPGGFDAIAVLNDWRRRWQDGRFPGSTGSTPADLREVAYKVHPLTLPCPDLDFALIEVAGERLSRVQSNLGERPELPAPVFNLIANDQVTLQILLIINPSDPSRDEVLFSNFFTYLENHEETAWRLEDGHFRLGIVLPDPETALQTLRQARPAEVSQNARLTERNALLFIETFIPSALRRWAALPKSRRMMTMFSVGQIEHRTVSNGREERIIVAPEFEDARRLFAWIYHGFTGRQLRPSPWRRFLNWLRGSGDRGR